MKNNLFSTKQATKILEKAFGELEQKQQEKLKNAPKHKCKKKLIGTARRVTGKNDIILKRPVIIARFYECAVCGKNM